MIETLLPDLRGLKEEMSRVLRFGPVVSVDLPVASFFPRTENPSFRDTKTTRTRTRFQITFIHPCIPSQDGWCTCFVFRVPGSHCGPDHWWKDTRTSVPVVPEVRSVCVIGGLPETTEHRVSQQRTSGGFFLRYMVKGDVRVDGPDRVDLGFRNKLSRKGYA